MKHQQTSVCLLSKLTAMSWKIKLWGVTEKHVNQWVRLTYPISPYLVNQVVALLWPLKLISPRLLEQGKRLVLTVETEAGAINLKLVSSELQRQACFCSPLTESLQ